MAAVPRLFIDHAREDWLFLWKALSPSTAPEGAGGIFFRPLGEGLWWLQATLGGDAAWPIQGIQYGLSLLLPLLLLLWFRRRGATATMAMLGAVLIALHPALLELRQWGAASNGLLAANFAVGGLLLLGRNRKAAALGWLLLLLAPLARVDALALWLLIPGVGGRRGGMLFLPGLVALTFLLIRPLGLDFHPEISGELTRRMLFPFGGDLPERLAVSVGLALFPAGVFLLWVFRGRLPQWNALALIFGGLWISAFLPLAPAGRYLLFPLMGAALILALSGFVLGAPGRVFWAIPLALLALVSNLGGSLSSELRERSRVERALHDAVAFGVPAEGQTLVLLDAPPMGWRGNAADASNPASCAARRDLAVSFDPATPGPRLILWWDGGRFAPQPPAE